MGIVCRENRFGHHCAQLIYVRLRFYPRTVNYIRVICGRSAELTLSRQTGEDWDLDLMQGGEATLLEVRTIDVYLRKN